MAKGKKMVITIDVATGKLDSVTNENGDPAQKGTVSPTDPIMGKTIIDMQSVTLMRTKSSPGCEWIFIAGSWHYICD